MEPFVHLPDLNIVICKDCKFACIAAEVRSHLQTRHKAIRLERRRAIEQEVEQIPGIIRSQADLLAFQFPSPDASPIQVLGKPATDGLKCRECPYIARQVCKIQEHCRKQHGWQNERRRGRVRAELAAVERQLPWTEGVYCQRLFRSRYASGWFEVRQEMEEGPEEDMDPRVRRIFESQLAGFAADEEMIRAAEEKLEPNLWLRRVGWAVHLQGLDRDRLRESIKSIEKDEDE